MAFGSPPILRHDSVLAAPLEAKPFEPPPYEANWEVMSTDRQRAG